LLRVVDRLNYPIARPHSKPGFTSAVLPYISSAQHGYPRSAGRYKLLVKEALRCTFIEYEGPPDGIANAWQDLVRDTLEAGYTPSGESRTVFAAGGAAAAGSVRLEQQLGIE
jgi:hypothetical protein